MPSSTSKILVAVSSSWASERIAKPLGTLAQRLQASIVIAHVATITEADEHESDATKRGEQAISTLKEALAAQQIESEGVILFGNNPHQSILEAADKHNCSMIVIGLTNEGIWKRLNSGDVPANIIRKTNIPLLVIPADWQGDL